MPPKGEAPVLAATPARRSAQIDAADQVGADTVFTVDGDTSLTLKGVQLASLAQDDFRFV